jgi:hypothetical protein
VRVNVVKKQTLKTHDRNKIRLLMAQVRDKLDILCERVTYNRYSMGVLDRK